MEVNAEFGPYRNLACAIIRHSARDYRKSLKKLMKDPSDINALNMKEDLERFFMSTWYSQLTDINSNYLIIRIRKEVGYID